MKKFKKALKRQIRRFYMKHYKICIALFIIIGIALGCIYQGRGDLGELIFSSSGYTVYVGGFKNVGVDK